MKVICAWCKKVLAEYATDRDLVSHGICPECLSGLIAAGPLVSLRDFLDRLDFPVLVTDGSVTIQRANRMAERLFGRRDSELDNTDVGCAIECRHAQESGECGRTEYCSGCILRQTLLETHADGRPRYGMYSQQEILTPSGGALKRLRYSTTQIGDAVILAIEEIQELSAAS